MGCTTLELSLGGPEQIKRILCVFTNAFKCFFSPDTLQVLGYVGYYLNCWLAKALGYIAGLKLCHLGRLYIARTEQIQADHRFTLLDKTQYGAADLTSVGKLLSLLWLKTG